MTIYPSPKDPPKEKSPRKKMKRVRVKTTNPKRKAKEFARCYHSSARVEFVRGLPCVVTRKTPCENAHTESGGMGRKAHYTKIVPMIPEKHHELHDIGIATFLRKYPWLDFAKLEAETEAKWQEHLRREKEEEIENFAARYNLTAEEKAQLHTLSENAA